MGFSFGLEFGLRLRLRLGLGLVLESSLKDQYEIRNNGPRNQK
jgi:hypothetical protein